MIVLSASVAGAVTPGPAAKIARVTGATPAGEALPNPNHTDQSDALLGTDLGILWDGGDGEIRVVFGDTYGKGWGGNGAGPSEADWRSNVLALSRDADPATGLAFSRMIHDTPGHAKELLRAQRNEKEWTIIPTAGVSVGARQFLHYMAVRHWGAPGYWDTNEGGMAYSDDGGATWTRPSTPLWPNTPAGDSKFQQAAFAKIGETVYLLGTPNGRHGDAYLARVPGSAMLDGAAYQYWDGSVWRTGDEAAARPVVRGPIAELSVAYNSYFHRWLMVTLDENRHALVLRDAPALIGPWTDGKILASAQDFPALYGGYIDPIHNAGPDLYFTMSQWTPYNVFWMHASLKR
ncbi:hypothetical protein CCAX7_15520 [Capsulimonas corticalis]|uniref:Uncharacterized protein n=1 Tax=Capsulimonas corticalis TaxID=2219043 RepID=A0A402CZ84_9BACT|nr:hypothetical protein CCAX7_15520 [Capsulimonas corticalis]